MRYVLTALGLLALAGCNEGPATLQEAQAISGQCAAYGFKPGSEAFAQCVFQLDQNRVGKARQRRMALGDAMGSMGNSLQQNAAAQQQAAIANRPITCKSTPGLNGTVSTSCY